MLSRVQTFLFPALISVFALSYWLQIAGQRPSVVMFPAAIVLIIAVLVAVVVAESWRATEDEPTPDAGEIRSAAILVGMSVLYYFSLITLGFDISNLFFSLFGSLVMGLGLKRSTIVAVCTTIILFGLSYVMEFNTPRPFWL